jgi:hypothetical protein
MIAARRAGLVHLVQDGEPDRGGEFGGRGARGLDQAFDLPVWKRPTDKPPIQTKGTSIATRVFGAWVILFMPRKLRGMRGKDEERTTGPCRTLYLTRM